jgi:predicted secreted hydrolase
VWCSLCAFTAAEVNDAGWELAVPGYQIEFPRDHLPHFGYRTEWWYFTGNVSDENGRQFGYQLTFFRHGYRSPARQREQPASSRFVLNDLKFGHFALTDVSNRQFYYQEKITRGAYGEAGFNANGKLVWLDDWQAVFDGEFRLKAETREYAIDLTLEPVKPPVLQGDNGLSQKATGIGRASWYYSMTRLMTRGVLRVGDKSIPVSGTSWLDREWATNQLAPDQAGWDWFALQFSDGSELMLYQIRLKNGGIDQYSNGKAVFPDGSSRYLAENEFRLEPGRLWTSPRSGAHYPMSWKLEVPGLNLSAEITTPVDHQELALSVIYWEGAIRVTGRRDGRSIDGVGYMELTGYQGAIRGLGR